MKQTLSITVAQLFETLRHGVWQEWGVRKGTRYEFFRDQLNQRWFPPAFQSLVDNIESFLDRRNSPQ